MFFVWYSSLFDLDRVNEVAERAFFLFGTSKELPTKPHTRSTTKVVAPVLHKLRGKSPDCALVESTSPRSGRRPSARALTKTPSPCGFRKSRCESSRMGSSSQHSDGNYGGDHALHCGLGRLGSTSGTQRGSLLLGPHPNNTKENICLLLPNPFFSPAGFLPPPQALGRGNCIY